MTRQPEAPRRLHTPFTDAKRTLVDRLIRHGAKVAEAARQAGVNPKTVRSYIRARNQPGPRRRPGRPRLLSDDDITHLCNLRATGVTPRGLVAAANARISSRAPVTPALVPVAPASFHFDVLASASSSPGALARVPPVAAGLAPTLSDPAAPVPPPVTLAPVSPAGPPSVSRTTVYRSMAPPQEPEATTDGRRTKVGITLGIGNIWNDRFTH